MAAPTRCPECQFAGIRFGGLGTQKLEAEVKAAFPAAKVQRMDTDTMRAPGAHEAALERFRLGEIDILVGTQMIAKGLDFPNVTLVGVVNADVGLHLPDFRAAERTFQLVTQVAGRTGRGEKGGRVLVQTYSPEHRAIRAAMRHDYQLFVDEELPDRETFFYPPFSALFRIVIRGEASASTEAFAEHMGQQLRDCLESSDVSTRLLGPVPAPLAKLRGKYRYHLLLQTSDRDRLAQVLHQLQSTLNPPDGVQWIVDADALSML